MNKKRITDLELIKAYRKAAELNLPYYIITKADPTKKMQETMQAYRQLKGFGKPKSRRNKNLFGNYTYLCKKYFGIVVIFCDRG